MKFFCVDCNRQVTYRAKLCKDCHDIVGYEVHYHKENNV